MYSELIRRTLDSRSVWHSLRQTEEIAWSKAGKDEEEVVKAIWQDLANLRLQVPVSSPSYSFTLEVRGKGVYVHRHRCNVKDPSFGAEIADLAIVVDHYVVLPSQERRLLNTGISMIQAKRMAKLGSGLDPGQLYLMCFWPQLQYKGRMWQLPLLRDICAFYLFFHDDRAISQAQEVGSLVSAQYLADTNGLTEQNLRELIRRDDNAKVEPDFVRTRPTINGGAFPLPLGRFLRRALKCYLGCSGLRLREFFQSAYAPDLFSSPPHPLEASSSDAPTPKYLGGNEGGYVLRLEVTIRQGERIRR